MRTNRLALRVLALLIAFFFGNLSCMIGFSADFWSQGSEKTQIRDVVSPARTASAVTFTTSTASSSPNVVTSSSTTAKYETTQYSTTSSLPTEPEISRTALRISERFSVLAPFASDPTGLSVRVESEDYWLENIDIRPYPSQVNTVQVEADLLGIYIYSTSRDTRLAVVRENATIGTVAIRIVGGYPNPDNDDTLVSSWTVSEMQAFMDEVERRYPGRSEAMGIRDEGDGCVYAKLKWSFRSSPQNFRGFQEFAEAVYPVLTGAEGGAGETLPDFRYHEQLGDRSESLVTEAELVPLLGAGFVPEEAYWVSRFVRSIDEAQAEKIVIYRDGPWPKGYWGRCWAKEIETLKQEYRKLTVVEGEIQRGCSAGWNEVARRRPEGAAYVVIANADAAFRPNGVAHVPSMVRRRKEEIVGEGLSVGVFLFEWEMGQVSWSAFVLLREAMEQVGTFDENFFPAMSEDNDYQVRMGLAGMAKAAQLPPHIALVHGSVDSVVHVSGHFLRDIKERHPRVQYPRSLLIQRLFSEPKHYLYMKWYFPECPYKAPFGMVESPFNFTFWRLDESRLDCIRAGGQHCTYHFTPHELVYAGENLVDWWEGLDPVCSKEAIQRNTATLSLKAKLFRFGRKVRWVLSETMSRR